MVNKCQNLYAGDLGLKKTFASQIDLFFVNCFIVLYKRRTGIAYDPLVVVTRDDLQDYYCQFLLHIRVRISYCIVSEIWHFRTDNRATGRADAGNNTRTTRGFRDAEKHTE